MVQIKRPTALVYTGAVACSVIAILLTLVTPLRTGLFFLLPLAVILLSARYGGWGPGLLSTLIAIVSSAYQLLPPFASQPPSADDAVRLGAFALVALFVTGFATSRENAKELERMQAFQQAAVARLGQHALATLDLPNLLTEAVRVVCDTLQVEFCEILELEPDRQTLVVKAGHGWKPESVGRVIRIADKESQARHTLATAEPVIVRDIRRERRFQVSAYLQDHGVTSGATVAIPGHFQPYGILGTYAMNRRAFSREDIHFLQSMANVLGMAMERGKTEKEIRDQREWLNVTLSSIGDGVIATDREGRITFANAVAEELTGWSLAEIQGKPSGQALSIVEEDSATPMMPIERAIDGGEPVKLNRAVLTMKEGKRVPVDDSAAPIRDGQGNLLGAVMVLRDVSVREQAERALRESEDRYRTIAQTATDGIITVDQDSRIVTVNPAAERIFGYAAAQLVDRDFSCLIREGEREKLADMFTHLRETAGKQGSHPRLELDGLHRDGRFVPLEISFGEFHRDGKSYFTGVIRDVTERRNVQDQLKFQANVLENIRDSVIVTDSQGNILYWNDGATAIFGYAAQEMMGRNVALLYPDEEKAQVVANLERIAGGQDYQGEWKGRRKDGSLVWVNIKTTVLYDNAGHPNGLIGVSTDVTARKLAQDRLVAQYAVTRALAESNTIEQAAPKIIEPICVAAGWDLGVIWVLDPSADVLRCVGSWRRHELDFHEFLALTHEMLFVRDMGLPGKVWSTGRPQWVRDMAEAAEFARSKVAAKSGLHGATGFSILTADGFLGVIEFYSRQARTPDEMLIEMMDTLPSQVSQFIQRTRAEQALRAAEEQHSIILHGVADGITVQDPKGRLVYANQAAAQLIGFETPQELLETPLHEVTERFEITDQEGNPFPVNQLPGRLVIEQGRGASALLRFRIKAIDQERWSHVYATPVLDESGQARLAINIFHDVTENRRSEQVVRDQRELLRVTLASIGDGVISTDTAGRIRFMNPVAEQLTGWTLEESLERPLGQVFNVVNEESHLPAENPVSRVLREQAVVGLANHTLLIAKNGRRISIENSGAPIRASSGEVVGVVLVFRDVTEQKRTERDVSRLAAIVRSSDDAIISMTLDGTILTWNPAAERLFGYSADDAVGRPISLIYPPDRLGEFDGNMARLRRGETIDHFDTVRVTKDGRRVDVSLSISLIRDAEGRVIGTSKIVRDISERKQAEDAARFLAEASEVLSSSLDYGAILENIARMSVPRIGDWCSVHILRESGQVEQVALVHVDPAKVQLARDMQRRFPPSPDAPFGVYQVLRTGKPELFPLVTDEQIARVTQDPERLKMLMELGGVQSSMVVPMIARGRTLGALSFVTGESGRRLGPADLSLAQDLARRAALAVDNARLYKHAQALNEELEQRVVQRTIELQETNRRLEKQAEQRQLMNLQLRLLSGHLQSAREEERIRIAREIHDEIGQVLSAIKMDLGLLGRELALGNGKVASVSIREQIDSSMKLVDTALETMHNIVRELRPEVLDHLGLPAALEWQIQEFQARTHIDCSFASSVGEIELDPERSTALFRILQETLTNIARHANATQVEAAFRQENHHLVLEVRDNGRGIPESALSQADGQTDHFGILGMRERARILGGDISINGVESAGTVVTVRIPSPSDKSTP